MTANGRIDIVKHVTTCHAELAGRITRIDALLMPALSEDFILGMDFLINAHMVIDFFDKTWHYRDKPEEKHSFVPIENASRIIMCRGLRTLEKSQSRKLKEFLAKHLPTSSDKPGVTSLTSHRIDVGDSPAIRQKPYHTTPAIRDIMWKEVDSMLENEIIVPSQSDWSSPIVMVKKPNGKYRFCIDFRKVNEVTKKDAYPIPNMTGILDELRQAHYITTLDLSQAYFQIPLEEKSREITAFVVPGRGLYHFLRMPYGLTNAPATFQRLLDKLIGQDMYPQVFVYLDDIIIVSQAFEEHLQLLEKVLDKIKKAGLVINRDKSDFCCSQVKYLGFLVNSAGLQVDPDKIEPVLGFATPRTVKQLRRFLGMASWYRRFISQFATIADPLYELLRKNRSWQWTENEQFAFELLKYYLTTSPTLACPNFELPFTLQTDASTIGLGAVLTQVIDGEERVIAYASRALTAAERKYTVTELECLAVLWSITKLRCYLEGYSFTVITDHSSLRWLHNLKNPTGRLSRWALSLLEYDYKIIHRKGALHHVPDALSRSPEGLSPDDETIEKLRETKDQWYNKHYRNVSRAPDLFPDWKINDGKLYNHRPADLVSTEMEDLSAWKMVLPRELRDQAISECHDTPQSGHLGVDKTYRRVHALYYWPNMFRDIVAFVRSCQTCQKCKVEQTPPAGLMGRRIVQEPWTTIAADIVGPITRSKAGNSYVLVLQDLFTKWIEVIPLRRVSGKIIGTHLENIIVNRWGAPRVFFSDNGREFANKDLRATLSLAGIDHQTTAPYHPQANPVERVNRVLKSMIRAFIEADHTDWDIHLPEFRFAYNTAYHSALQATPAFANLGREPLTAISLRRQLEGDVRVVPGNTQEWLERMRRLETLRRALSHALNEASNQQAHYYDLRHRPREFEEGHLVWRVSHPLSNAAKRFSAALVPPYEGPFMIAKKISRTRYVLTNLKGKPVGETSVQDLKPYHPRGG